MNDLFGSTQKGGKPAPSKDAARDDDSYSAKDIEVLEGLVHRIVDDFGEQVVQRLLVGAADIHAGAAAHGLQALQHLDVGCRVGVRGVDGFARTCTSFGHVWGRVSKKIA